MNAATEAIETITYNLRNGHDNSNHYYKDIKDFSQRVERMIEQSAGGFISEYQNYLSEVVKEAPRSRGEYMVELLTLGMTWKKYLGAALHTNRFILYLCDHLYSWRSRYIWIKPEIDRLRGWLNGRFLAPAVRRQRKWRNYSSGRFARLLLWLRASGEFQNEVKRLRCWQGFLITMDKSRAESIFEVTHGLVDWFNRRAKPVLESYCDGLAGFLEEKHPSYRGREDELFTGKSMEEYFLNMVGAEIMNRGFTNEYLRTRRTVALLPKCMANSDSGHCQCRQSGYDLVCSQCSPNCRIAQLTRLGEEKGFEVCIIPHAANFIQRLKRWQNDPDVGLIAVACLLNLVPGGYEIRNLGLHAQCLLLDYCGCRKHWHPEGIPTDINEDRLLELLK